MDLVLFTPACDLLYDGSICTRPYKMTETASHCSITEAVLPPCRICGEKASGFHYGVNTCEACKGFFRRSLQRKEEYKCPGIENCEISPGKRNACAFCRFKKCLSMGMSKEAIKTGRYTLEKRTKDIQEVKRLQKAELSPPLGNSDEDLEELIAIITKAHDIYGQECVFDEEEVKRRQRIYYEEYKLKESVFGELPAISKEEYHSFYHSTGIDLDNRLHLMEVYAKSMEENVRRFVNFSKSIPCFQNLTISDQSSLIKASRFEFWYLGNFNMMNPVLKVAMGQNGACYHFEEISRIWDRDFLEAVFHFSEGLQKLHLDCDEIGLIQAISIMSVDRCTLEEPKKVEEIQLKLVNCLDYFLTQRDPTSKQRLAKIFDRLMSLRTLTEWNVKLIHSMKVEWAVFRENPLLYEIMTI
ncbi:vitamin D3 receptor-like isoform X2 [Octopus vulgaris]|uniref:Vitamin D3 receptor-like isoform X2 n=3 Tax=Octopus TaxID=6643 RepID=A0AA36AV38_OCTVU|nr:vitamin D3 receptor-like isoform X2 [Octopus vulgaris]